MPERDPIANDARAGRRQRRDAVSAICMFCGKRFLKVPGARRTGTEDHHPLGRHYEPRVTWPVCPECHEKFHEVLRRLGVELRKPANVFVAALTALRTLGATLPIIGRRLLQLADELERTLDVVLPGWRKVRVSR